MRELGRKRGDSRMREKDRRKQNEKDREEKAE